MSIVTEFAEQLENQRTHGSLTPVQPTSYTARTTVLRGVRAVVFDVYGTLIHYWHNQFASPEEKQEYLLTIFRKTSDNFGFTPILEKIDSSRSPEETLSNFYHGLILLKHEELQARGKSYPEVQIEQIWNVILSMLMNNGYEFEKFSEGSREDFSRCIAYYYNFHALARGFFEGVVPALEALKKQGMVLGIISNAQFYTPLDLSFFIRHQSNEVVDYLEIFEDSLCFFSYEFSVAKPNPIYLRKLFDALYELQILPEHTVFIGNDLVHDVQFAQEAGLKTALFTGNKESLFLHDKDGQIIPDVSFSHFKDLPKILQFHEGA